MGGAGRDFAGSGFGFLGYPRLGEERRSQGLYRTLVEGGALADEALQGRSLSEGWALFGESLPMGGVPLPVGTEIA